MSPGRVTYPTKREPEEPGGAAKTALEVAAGILVVDSTAEGEPIVAGHGEVEHVRFEDVEASALESLTGNPVLHYGTPRQRAKAAYELRKKAAGGETEGAGSGGPSPAATSSPAAPSGEEGPSLSPLAARLEQEPETRARLAAAEAELQQREIDKLSVEELYGSEDEDFEFEWPEPEPPTEGGGA